MSGADCTIYKSLRTTIRVFLKTEEKKREASRPKAAESAPPTPVESAPPNLPAQMASGEVHGSTTHNQSQSVEASDEAAASVPNEHAHVAAQDDAVVNDSQEQSQEVRGYLNHGRSRVATNGWLTQNESTSRTEENTEQQSTETTEVAAQEGDAAAADNADEDAQAGDEDQDNSQQNGTSYGVDASGGSFNGMNYAGGDMNQMQMMMAMQNGMNPAAFGTFPMPGMYTSPVQRSRPLTNCSQAWI